MRRPIGEGMAHGTAAGVLVILAGCAGGDLRSPRMPEETLSVPSPGPGRCSAGHPCRESTTFCAPPDQPDPPECGTCYAAADACVKDDECKSMGAAFFCEPTRGPCVCAPARHCEEGCLSDATCGPLEQCAPDHRCVPKPCADDAACPRHHRCGSDTHLCARHACSRDADCRSGYCVNEVCFDAPGTCHAKAPVRIDSTPRVR